MNKIIAYFTSICFFIILISISVFTLLKENNVFSPLENRYLTTFPNIQINHILDGTYQEEIEKAIDDQIVFRDTWAMIESYSEEAIGKVENNGVYFGKNQYLMERFSTYDQEQVKYNINQINQFKQKNEVNVAFLLVPNSAAVLTNKLPVYHQDIKIDALYQTIDKQLNSTILFINPLSSLRLHQQESIYFKGDHHWNLNGAFYGYQEFKKQQNHIIVKKPEMITVNNQFKGSMIRSAHRYLNQSETILKLRNNDEVVVQYDKVRKDSLYVDDNLKMNDKYTYYLNGQQAHVHIDCRNNKEDKLLIIRDSFANIMLPYLVNDYQSIDVIDMRYDHESMSEFIKKNDINQVLFLYNIKNFVADKNFVFLK